MPYRRRNTPGVAYHPRIFAMHRTMELREQLREQEEKRRYKRYLAGSYWLQRGTVAYWALRDNVEGGDAWYDDDKNVPTYGSAKDRTMLVEAHIREAMRLPRYKASLYKDVFIWSYDNAAFIFQRSNKDNWTPISFADVNAARAFVDNLPYLDIYGGFVVGGQALKMQANSESKKES